MSILESVSLALGSLRTNKMRSALTLLGVIIGIASVIAILTLGHALKTQTTSGLEGIGINDYNAEVRERTPEGEPEPEGFNFGPPVTEPDALITPEMIDDLRSQFGPDISEIQVGGYGGTPATASTDLDASKQLKGLVRGINVDFQRTKSVKIGWGRELTDEDIDGDRPVAVVPEKLATSFYGSDPAAALGNSVTIETDFGTADFQIVGVTKKPEEKGGLLSFDDNQVEILVPYPSEAKVAEISGAFPGISIRLASPTGGSQTERNEHDAQVKKRLQAFFDERYQDNKDYKVKVTDQKQNLASVNKILTSISAAIAAIGGISLLVGGIGVMNIMLITVTERTREIGVRKALGATRRDIRLQFVVEAMIVCLMGGLLGVIFGGAVGMLGAKLMGEFVFPPLSGIVISLVFSLAIGLFFGSYPAGKAAKLNPIEALRYE